MSDCNHTSWARMGQIEIDLESTPSGCHNCGASNRKMMEDFIARAEKAENESRILGKLLDESMSDLEGGVSPSEVIARVKRYRFLRVKETDR